MKIYYPLKTQFKIDENGDVREQIKNRVNSEDNYTWAKNYQLIKEVDKK